MSKNIAEIPYTEIVERVKSLSREGRNSLERVRGVVQDVYIREIPAKFDWSFLLVSSSFTTIDQYNVGNATINTGNTTATFSSDATITAGMVNRKIKFQGNDTVYDITVINNSSSITVSPSFQGPFNISNGAYVIFQPIYALTNDFDRFPKPGGVYRWNGSKKEVLEELQYRPYLDKFQANPNSTTERTRLISQDTAGNQLVELIPSPNAARNYGYDYFKVLKPMRETTAGTLSLINANSTQVVGNTNCKFLEANTGDWIRVDALGRGSDSQWYRIATISHNSLLTISTNFANTAITSSASYTIASAPEMPVRLHVGILYGAVRSSELDQSDPNFAFYHSQYAQVLSDAKKIYVSRPYNQEVTGIHEEYNYRY